MQTRLEDVLENMMKLKDGVGQTVSLIDNDLLSTKEKLSLYLIKKKNVFILYNVCIIKDLFKRNL